jgi:hypothetical protein
VKRIFLIVKVCLNHLLTLRLSHSPQSTWTEAIFLHRQNFDAAFEPLETVKDLLTISSFSARDMMWKKDVTPELSRARKADEPNASSALTVDSFAPKAMPQFLRYLDGSSCAPLSTEHCAGYKRHSLVGGQAWGAAIFIFISSPIRRAKR